jgi:ubiquinone/menaquinone biosynthesis C-methylase UbiE
MKYDDTRIPENYDRARDHGIAVHRQWMDLVAAHAAPPDAGVILDVGCGTARFSFDLATTFRSTVIGVDPSEKMLHEARKKGGVARVWFARGVGEALPVAAQSADLVFMSMVFHHFRDPARVGRECRRVLRPRGRVFLRTASSEQIQRYPYVPFFPTARPLLDARIPSIRAQRAAFEQAGFEVQTGGVEVQEIARDHAAYADKLAAGADSVLASLPEHEFRDGLRAIRDVTTGGAVTEPIDYVVFSRP